MTRLHEVVSFRRDLLFSGAVELGWLETQRELARRAAEHFAFHGPRYHGVVGDGFAAPDHQLVDTATFTLDLLLRLTGWRPGEPFTLAVAGYGTGKSHFGVTLASLLGNPRSQLAERILSNLWSADEDIGERVRSILSELHQPFLVVALNGMKNFDLTAEVVRQVMAALRENDQDTSPLEELRPRFRQAAAFVSNERSFDAFREEFQREFGAGCRREEILERLAQHDEEAFRGVAAVVERVGLSVRAVGQESLHDFLRVVGETYCGEGKPFAGVLIIFDELGRYMEFAVARPHLAGSGALQQLYEGVQANGERIFLLAFMQFEPRAYLARIAPEMRDELERYVSRYEAVPRVRLSTNLETLIASLLQKRDPDIARAQLRRGVEPAEQVHTDMRRWFPEIANHAVWANRDTLDRVVRHGCWPLHPLATWVLFKLAAMGRALHQRSALSLLADVFQRYQDVELPSDGHGFSIAPADLCVDELVSEFLISERLGRQAPIAQAYQTVVERYGRGLTESETRVLKSVLLLTKTGARVAEREDWLQAIACFAGRPVGTASDALQSLERERGILSWNGAVGQYEIRIEGVSRSEFLRFVNERLAQIPVRERGGLFARNFHRWFPNFIVVTTDFGVQNDIATRDWDYRASFGDVTLLRSQIDMVVRDWQGAVGIDEPKGRLIYCYVGPDSDMAAVRDLAETWLRSSLKEAEVPWEVGVPIAVCLLHDADGSFGERIAEFQVLRDCLTEEEADRFANFIPDRVNDLEQELRERFRRLQDPQHVVFATSRPVDRSSMRSALLRLFDVVYSQRIPFPFDGLGTPAGNAANCCREITRQLFLGGFDHDWIAGCAPCIRNRAHHVLVESWQTLRADGRLMTWPGNQAVRRLVDLLDSWLERGADGSPGQLGLGRAFRTLCAPPYGCNVASAGVVLAYFFGARKECLSLMRGGQWVGVETWLGWAMPRRFLEVSALDDTVVVQAQAPDEWRTLLDSWELEKTHVGRVAYLEKCRELETRQPVPAALYYRYEHTRQWAHASRAALQEHDRKLNEVAEKVQSGMESDDFGRLSWGAADLASLLDSIRTERDLWTAEQIKEVERHAAEARVQVQQRFPRWLPRQRETSVARIQGWARWMERICDNLGVLGLHDEESQLRRHVEDVRSSVMFLEDVRILTAEIRSFVDANVIGDGTAVMTLRSLKAKADELGLRVTEASQHGAEIVRADLDEAQALLREFRERCDRQLGAHRRQLEDVINSEVRSLADVSDLRATLSRLGQVFNGDDTQLAVIDELAKELRLVEGNWSRLISDQLSDSEFDALLKRCAEEREAAFQGEPPLYNDPYEGIAETIRRMRREKADEWVRNNVPDATSIAAASAHHLRDLVSRLRSYPRLLSVDQERLVRGRVEECERRLDELEVEGMLARFESIPDEGRMAFLHGIRSNGLIARLCSLVGCGQSGEACHWIAQGASGCRCPLLRVSTDESGLLKNRSH